MNRAIAFARLDYLTITPYLTLKNMLIFLFVFAIIGYGSGEPSALIGLLMMYGTIYAAYPFAVGDKNGIDTLYATLPLTKRDIVIGRYIFAITFNILTGVAALAISAIFMTAFGKGFNFGETAIAVFICFVLFSILEAIQLPIYFKLGYAKAKFLVYLSLAMFPAVVMVISAYVGASNFLPFINSVFSWVQMNIWITVILVMIIWILAITLSLMMSYRFYNKREF